MQSMANLLVAGLLAALLALPSSLGALVDKALRLDGVDDFAETPDTPALHMGGELTVTGWFRVNELDGGSNGWQDIFWKGDAPDHSPYHMREYALQLHKAGFLYLSATPKNRLNTGHLHIQTPNRVIGEGQWYHFGAVVSSAKNALEIYVDGQLQASGPFDPSGMRDTGGVLRLGGLPGRDFFGGELDEIQFWNRALTRFEIERIMNQPPVGGEPGLVAQYDFDDLDDQMRVPDRSGNGHSLHLRTGARTLAADTALPPLGRREGTRDMFVRSLQLDGRGDYLEVHHAAMLQPGAAVTIEGWFRPESVGDGWQGVFSKGTGTDMVIPANLEYALWLGRGGVLQLASVPLGHSGASLAETPTPVVQAGRWQHIAAVIDGGSRRQLIYVDGVLRAESHYGSNGIRPLGGTIKIGTGLHHADFNGQVDEVRLWNRALGPGEVDRAMRHALDGSEPGLVARYAFDAVAVDREVSDFSGHGHRGALRGDAQLATEHIAKIAVPGPLQGAAADLIIMALEHHDVGVRRRAVQGLDRVGHYDFNRVMEVALRHDDAWVRRHAAGVLGRAELGALPKGARDQALVIALNHWDADVRRRAVEGLERLPVADATTAMEVALAHHDPLVRRRAADILARAEYADVPRELMQEDYARTRPYDRGWSPDGYRGWERRWEAPRTTVWNLEPEGLLGRYNRVEGAYLAWHLPRNYHPGAGLTNYGEVGYSFGQEEFSYQAGAEVFSFYNPANARDNLVTFGGEIHDLTDSQDRWLITDEENSVDAVLFRRDYRDYYRRTGWSVYTAHNFGGALQVTGRYGWEEFASLANTTHWVAFDNRFTRAAFRPNPAVDESQVRSLRADVQFDTRDNRHRPHQGWFANALFERAGGVLGGEAEFKRYLGDVRRYQPVGRGTRVDVRLRVGTAKGRLPDQYLYDLGGLSTLRSYGFKEFTGDRMVLFNAEYWVDGDAHWRHGEMPLDDLALGVFFDAGSAWFADDAQNPFDRLDYLVTQPDQVENQIDLRQAFGFGLEMGDTRLNIARALDGEGNGWKLSARFGRSF